MTSLWADLSADSVLTSVSNLGAAGLFAWAILGLLKDTLKASRDQLLAAVQVFREELAAERKSCSEERALDRAARAEEHKDMLGRFDRLEMLGRVVATGGAPRAN